MLGELLQGKMAGRDLKGDGREKRKGVAAGILLLTANIERLGTMRGCGCGRLETQP